MSTIGIIAEYNPFHFGHKHHIESTKKLTKSDNVVVIMSGSFVQRGQPAFMDKWTRSKIAINSGADLVIELPTIFATQSAEQFAYGSIKLLDSLNIINYVSFGSESGSIEQFNIIGNILNEEPDEFRYKLKENLNIGLSFPVSREKALLDYIKIHTDLNINEFKNIINKPNNILSIEYIKALNKINSNITPFTIRRKGSGYNDDRISNDFLSATAIRKLALSNDIELSDHIPDTTYDFMMEYKNTYGEFNKLENYQNILNYIINTSETEYLNQFIDMEDGLSNRFKKIFAENLSLEKSISQISTKRYTKTRIQRILTHILLDFKKNDFLELSQLYPNYVRILAANNKGIELISKIKDNSNLKIINKFANIENEDIKKIIYYDKLSTDLYSIGINHKINLDYYNSPYIKKASK